MKLCILQEKDKKKILQKNQGSSLLFVIVLLSILSMTALGFSFLVRMNLSVIQARKQKIENQVIAESIHKSICAYIAEVEWEGIEKEETKMIDDGIGEEEKVIKGTGWAEKQEGRGNIEVETEVRCNSRGQIVVRTTVQCDSKCYEFKTELSENAVVD